MDKRDENNLTTRLQNAIDEPRLCSGFEFAMVVRDIDVMAEASSALAVEPSRNRHTSAVAVFHSRMEAFVGVCSTRMAGSAGTTSERIVSGRSTGMYITLATNGPPNVHRVVTRHFRRI